MTPSQSPERNEAKTISPSEDISDLTDSAKDEKVMEEEETVFDLPDVADIPGQENIVPPKMGMFADTTISSDDEEGADVFDEEDQEEL